MIKNIVFDWSGVISDNGLFVYEVVIEMFRKSGIPKISLEEFKSNWEQPYMRFYNKYLPDMTLEEEQKLYRETYQELIAKNPTKPYPGIVETLKSFYEKGINMVILSSDHEETILKDMKDYGVELLFKDIIFGIHDKKEGIKDLINRNNFKKEETVFIGDTCHEVETGKFSGIKTAVVTWGFDTEDKLRLSDPDYIIHNLKELEEIIL